MAEITTPQPAETGAISKPGIEQSAKAEPQLEQSAPGKAATVEPAKPPLPPNPESPLKALGKGLVEAGADFTVAATTPYGAPNPEPVRIFNKPPEQNLTIPDAAREAFRLKTAEQMLGLRWMKTEQPMQRKPGVPDKLAAVDRRAEPARQIGLKQARSQLAQVQAALPKAA